MVWCNHCDRDVEAETDVGSSYCSGCGQVLEDAAFSNEVTFTKGPGGESEAVGQRVMESGAVRGAGSLAGGRNHGATMESREKSLARGRSEIASLVSQLQIPGPLNLIESAHRYYVLALSKNFTRGRRTAQVAAACIYLVCRDESDPKPFMLIDFSDALQVNVFVLGAVYLQLLQVLRLQNHASFARPLDPSLYLHRFSAKLGLQPERKRMAVYNTAMQLVKSMKRDWMTTGRRPSGICGAALFIALHVHGFQRSKTEVVRAVHVGVGTLEMRLREFSATDAGSLTSAQLLSQDKEIEQEHARLADRPHQMQLQLVGAAPPSLPALPSTAAPADPQHDKWRQCAHVGKGTPPTPVFAHDLCRHCYVQYLQRSGGQHAGALPPAFAANLRKEEKARQAAEERRAALEAAGMPGSEGEEVPLTLLPPRDGSAEGTAAGGEGSGELEQDMAAAMDAMSQVLPGGAALLELEGAPPPHPSTRSHASSTSTHASTGDTTRSPADGNESIAAVMPSAAAEAAVADSAPRPHQRRRLNSGAALDAASEFASPAAGKVETAASQGTHADAPAAAAPSHRRVTFADEGDAKASAAEAPLTLIDPATNGDEVAAVDGEDAEVAEPAPETFSDLDDDEMDTFLLSKEERTLKEKVWTALNMDWLAKQAAKDEALAAGEKLQADREAAAAAAEASGVGVPPKRGRGRPVGSKTKNHGVDPNAPVAATTEEAARRMLAQRKLSSKINYSALADLFADADHAGGEDSGEKEAPRKGPGVAASSPAVTEQVRTRLGRGSGGGAARVGARGRTTGLLDELPTMLQPSGGLAARGGSRPAARGGAQPRVRR